MNALLPTRLLFIALAILSACAAPSPQVEPIPMDEFDIQGHRGSRGHLPENSIPGFILALEQGATTLELDLVVSADSQLVVNHEPWLNPELCLTPEGEPVREQGEWNLYRMPMKEIRQCDCGSRPHPRFTSQKQMAVNRPALWEVVQVSDHMRTRRDSIKPAYNIELKFDEDDVHTFYPEAEDFANLVIVELTALGIQERATLQSFSAKALDAVHARAPEISTSWLTDDNAPVKEQVQRLTFVPTIYSPNHNTLTAQRVAEARSMGMKVIPWTVNEPERMKELIEMGVNGIITDYPDLLWSVVTEVEETQEQKQE